MFYQLVSPFTVLHFLILLADTKQSVESEVKMRNMTTELRIVCRYRGALSTTDLMEILKYIGGTPW